MPGTAPPHNDDEKALLLAYVQQQRDGVRNAAFGLTEEQIRLAPTASALTIGGLVKHVTSTERGWIADMLQRPSSQDEQSYGEDFQVARGDTLASLLADLDRAAAETEAAVAGVDLSDPVPVPDAPWFPKDVEAWSVRWVLLHLVEEIARHAGHADILRETIDGARMYELMAGREGWPATPWLTPWQPPAG
jgi:uncharacterized damage-inducible protein DinB